MHLWRYIVIMMVVLTLVGCAASGTAGTVSSTNPIQATSTVPTVSQNTKVKVTAPFDIMGPVTDDVELCVVEDYQLFARDEKYYNHYGNSLSSGYFCIMIWPVILEESLQNVALEFEAATNYGGLYCDINKMGECAGWSAHFADAYIAWRGNDAVPSQYRQDVKPDRVWIDIIVRMDGNIVGFAVFEIVPWDQSSWVSTSVYKYSEFYSSADDAQSQEITEDFVLSRIEACHQYFMNNAE